MSKTRAALPIEPLWEVARTMSDNPEFTTAEMARSCNTTERAVNRWRAKGSVPWVSADEAAIALGLHPILVWGDAWLNVKGDFDKLANGIIGDLEDEVIADISEQGLSD